MATPTRFRQKTAWAVVTSAAVGLMVWITWPRAENLAVTSSPITPPAFVQVTGVESSSADRLLRERAELFDPTPLFFPTEWNYGQDPPGIRRQRELGQVFAPIQPQFTFPENNPRFFGAEAVAIGPSLSEVLAQGTPRPLAGLGQVDVSAEPLSPRSAFLTVSRFGQSGTVIAQALTNLELPRTEFAPMEFMVFVSPAGVVGEPVLVSGSGLDEVDVFFRNYLIKAFRVGDRLAPGRYRVAIGP